MQKTVSSIALLLLSLAFLSACGQKGPLFLPGNPSQIQTVPSPEQEQINSETDDEDEEEPTTNRN
ncbi:MAG: LPS translocon maturation chaperone LptM [Woeseiaceae bacterium]